MQQIGKLELPIDAYIPDILNAVQNYSTVLVKASPGSGKTTRLPWAIAEGLLKKVVVLEPRRLAAKLAAQRIAEEQSLSLGKEVGFHFRFEKNYSHDSRLIFYTEGTFLKRFLNDPGLKDVDIVILDEFHERHLETDLALAYLRSLQTKRDLKIVLMSATLDMKLMDFLPKSKAIEIDAKMYPVDVTYLPNQPSVLNQSLESKVKKAVELSPLGDVLVFLPGMREMLRVKEVLQDQSVHLLHADLPKEEQDLAIRPSKTRKIILSTNIAESSVTIPGVSVVIDSGIQREAHYSPWNGLKFIVDVPVTKSSAIQRAGRAGRTGPGKCFRLYSEQDFCARPDHTVPEIHKADLTDICLLTASTELQPLWFEAPNPEKWKKSLELLTKLGAIENTNVTEIGKRMLQYPLDSRLSRILVEGEDLVLSEKEKLLRYICHEIEEDKTGALRRRLQFFLKDSRKPGFPWEKCVLTGFIDQVAKFRSKQHDFIHYSGKTIKAHSSLQHLTDGFYLVIDITQRQEAIKILPVEEEWLWDMSPFPFTEEEELKIDEKFSLSRKTKLGSIVIEESLEKIPWDKLSCELKEKTLVLAEAGKSHKITKFKETDEYLRLKFFSQSTGKNTDQFLDEITLEKFFSHQLELSWEGFEEFIWNALNEVLNISDVERMVPKKINLGGKRELIVHYPDGMDPYLEAPIQDFYGQNETPTIMQGKVPLTLKLLGPHKRPIQVTKDLKNFWQKTYQEMKKEYQREYPKHYWPDKPWEAKPFLLRSHLPKT